MGGRGTPPRPRHPLPHHGRQSSQPNAAKGYHGGLPRSTARAHAKKELPGHMSRSALLLAVVGAAASATPRTLLRPDTRDTSSRHVLTQLRGGGRISGTFGAALHGATATLFAARTEPKGQKAMRLERHVRGVVFGGMDGILTTFALLAAVAGSRHTSTSLTLVIGISTVLADALSMAAGEYLSAKAEAQMAAGAPPDEPGPLEKVSRR